MSTQPEREAVSIPRREPSARVVVAALARARELQIAGQWVAAEARYRAVLRLDPYQPQALLHLAALLDSLGRRVEALRYARMALDADPTLPGGRRKLDEILAALGRAGEGRG